MEGFSFRFFVAAILTICLFGLTAAQNSPQDYIAGHNAARAAVGVGQMVWDPTVAAFAQSYVNSHAGDCQMVHSTGSGYGENLFKGGAGKEWSASDAVALWVAEKQWYNYGTNTCAAGKVCGHYTQVVWRNSVKLGCGRVKCANGDILISCNYSPPGNIIGQKPY